MKFLRTLMGSRAPKQIGLCRLCHESVYSDQLYLLNGPSVLHEACVYGRRRA